MSTTGTWTTRRDGKLRPTRPPRRFTPGFIDAHLGALRLTLDCGLIGNARRWMDDEVIRAIPAQGTGEQQIALRKCEERLVLGEHHGREHGAGSLVRREHQFVRLLLRVSRIPGVSQGARES